MLKYTDYCPGCDQKLPSRIWDGEEWECRLCGEYGTFTARPSTGFEALANLTITNRNKAEKIYEMLKSRGVEIGNASIIFIEQVLDEFDGKSLVKPDDGLPF